MGVYVHNAHLNVYNNQISFQIPKSLTTTVSFSFPVEFFCLFRRGRPNVRYQ